MHPTRSSILLQIEPISLLGAWIILHPCIVANIANIFKILAGPERKLTQAAFVLASATFPFPNSVGTTNGILNLLIIATHNDHNYLQV
jgi:hypothetical protein